MRVIHLLLIGVFFVSLSSCFQETRKEKVYLGYKGEAKMNPYLLAQRYLAETGLEVVDQRGALLLDESHASVFLPASAVKSIGDAERLLDWVYWGGHAIVLVERGEDHWNDLADYLSHAPDRWGYLWDEGGEHSPGLSFIAEELSVELIHNEVKNTEEERAVDDSSENTSASYSEYLNDNKKREELDRLVKTGKLLPYTSEVTIEHLGQKVSASIGGSFTFSSSLEDGDGIFVDVDESGSQRIYSSAYSDGRVTLISDARLFRNPYLIMKDHAELLENLAVENYSEGSIVFNHGKVEGIFALLMRHFSVAVWALLILVLLWLWKNLPRFGPRQDIVLENERDQLAQLVFNGNFLWSKGRGDVLIEALRREIYRKLQVKEGYMTKEQFGQVSESSQLDVLNVEEAMLLGGVKDTNILLKVVRDLQQILKSI